MIEGLQSIQTLIAAVLSGGGGATLASIWNNRHKSKIERSKSQSEIYASDVATLRQIIDEQAEHHERIMRDVNGRLASLEARIERYRADNEKLERRMSKTELMYQNAEDYIRVLIQHINDGLGPPPPERNCACEQQ